MKATFRALALFLVSAAPLWAQNVQKVNVDVHPLLLGAPGNLSGPMGSALQAQALALKGLTPGQAAAQLTQLSQQGPAQAAASAVLAQALTEPAKLQTLISVHPELAATPVASLAPLAARTAADQPAKTALGALSLASQGFVDQVFEGRKASLGLEHVQLGDKAYFKPSSGLQPADPSELNKPVVKKGVELLPVNPIGKGEWGVVYPHPAIKGAILKLVEPSADATLFSFGVTMQKISDEEEKTSIAYADAGAGPRYFGRTVHDRRIVSVRERIYGTQVDRMMADRQYGPEEHQLMLDMFRRMAKTGLWSDDLKLSNIMIGTTETDPVRKAYVVDGGIIVPLAEGLDEEGRFNAIRYGNVRLFARLDPYVGTIESSRVMNEMLEEGLARQQDKTAWQRFTRFFKEMKNAPRMYGNPMR